MPKVSYLLIKLLTLCELKYGNTCIDLLGSRLSRISINNPMQTRLAYLLTFGCLEYHMAYILLLLGHRSITNTRPSLHVHGSIVYVHGSIVYVGLHCSIVYVHGSISCTYTVYYHVGLRTRYYHARSRYYHVHVERDMAQWLERGALPTSLPAVEIRIPLGAGYLGEITCFAPLNIGTLNRCCVLGQGTLPSHASLESGVNKYLVEQRWQGVRLVPSAEMAASVVCSKQRS